MSMKINLRLAGRHTDLINQLGIIQFILHAYLFSITINCNIRTVGYHIVHTGQPIFRRIEAPLLTTECPLRNTYLILIPNTL